MNRPKRGFTVQTSFLHDECLARLIDSAHVYCLNGDVCPIQEVSATLAMAKPPEVSKQDFDNLNARVQGAEKEARSIRASIGELTNTIKSVQAIAGSKVGVRHLLMAAAIVATSSLAVAAIYFTNRAATDKQVADTLESLRTQIVKNAEQASKTNERIAKVESKLDLLLGTILKDITKDIDLSKPTVTKAKLDAATSFLVEAKKQGYVIDPKIIEQGGKSLVRDAGLFENQQLAPAAWETTTQFAVYKSFLNERLEPVSSAGLSRLSVGIGPGTVLSKSYLAEVDVVLDGAILEDVIFKDCTIHYNGGALNLTNVRFQNCTFQVVKTSRGLTFIGEVLQQNPLTANARLSV